MTKSGPIPGSLGSLPPPQKDTLFFIRPHAIRHPDGTYLLFGIGQAGNASWQRPCKDGRPIMPDGKPATDADAAPIDHAQLHISKSPYGPWENVPGPGKEDKVRRSAGAWSLNS